LALAGDISNPLADKVYVIRNVEGEPEPVVVELSLKKAKERGAVENITLAPGDTVSVEKTPATIFYDTIRIISFGVGGSVF
jgi:polysaccharide export outer membrane protein